MKRDSVFESSIVQKAYGSRKNRFIFAFEKFSLKAME